MTEYIKLADIKAGDMIEVISNKKDIRFYELSYYHKNWFVSSTNRITIKDASNLICHVLEIESYKDMNDIDLMLARRNGRFRCISLFVCTDDIIAWLPIIDNRITKFKKLA